MQIIRANGTRVMLQYSKNYDPHHQPTEILTVPMRLMPGDQLLTSCIYDTSGEKEPVHWGQTAKDEMCFAYIYFYPAMYSIGCFNYHGEGERVRGIQVVFRI